ncbi:MAG TPA: hypothetical protein VJ864_01470 [Candidatus Binatia bacterium]|nr:hypothetical protein [Candidatus Binatia bacterium]
MGDIQKEIETFQQMRAELESAHTGEWVVIHNCQLIGFYASFEKAADDAVRKFGSGPYLIRQIGAPPLSLPASALYHFSNADH